MTEERIIIAPVVTSGKKSDRLELPKFLEISQENGIDLELVISDAAYSGKENLKITSEQNIKVVARLNPSITQESRKDENKFDYNKDADKFVCPAEHLVIRKARGGAKDGVKKMYSVSIKLELHQDQMVLEETEYYKEKAKHRYKVEAKNSELKNVHGYD